MDNLPVVVVLDNLDILFAVVDQDNYLEQVAEHILLAEVDNQVVEVDNLDILVVVGIDLVEGIVAVVERHHTLNEGLPM